MLIGFTRINNQLQQQPGRAEHVLDSTSLCRCSNRTMKNPSFTGHRLTFSRPVLDSFVFSRLFLYTAMGEITSNRYE